jgi:serine/threonine-protein kinase
VSSRSDDDDLTLAPPGATRGVTPFVARTTAPPTPSSGGRLAPGSIIAGRYRLVALLGRGGMGEVYRAEDLTLDQPVALKFLPEGVAADPQHLAQFHNELRVARQVSHKNVCRLYDLGEADGRRFLTMEYVDGEDLAALLRRIGRFPEDRAVAIARQLCAGVAAAHDRGVVHRDLKPANVMIDGNGDVRVTDFGIATAAADADGGLVGTPQYMAPEQLTGSAASIRTDLYALGLVLFEIFTGRRAYEARTLQDLKTLHESGATPTPSSIVRDLDPAIERVILRCLERDPAKRPASALAVAVALPGGDPLAAALAAGETPSPDMLAAAAETEAMPVLRGLALLGVVVACVAAYTALSPRATMANFAPLEKAPAVLADRALEIERTFGSTGTPADTASSFVIAPDFRRWIVETDSSLDRWNPARHPMAYGLLFWHRSSPRDMEPNRTATTVSSTDPPLVFSSQTLVVLDTRGRLVEFRRVPPQRDPPAADTVAPAWSAVFKAAGLDETAFTRVDPEWSPKDFADVRAAWEGPLPDAPGLRMRLEAAGYRGQVTSVFSIAPWARARAMAPPPPDSRWNDIRTWLVILLYAGIIAGGAVVARSNLQWNRADRRGAGRLAAFYLVLQLASWVIGAHHLSSAGAEFNNFARVGGVLFSQAAILWMMYLALEPYGRRFWPDGLLGWTRLLSGRIRDPRIGREILIGSAMAGALLLVDLFRSLSPLLLGRPLGDLTLGSEVEALGGFGALYGTWADQFYLSLQTALIFVMLLIVARLLIKRTWLAVLASIAFEIAIAGGGVPNGGVGWLYFAAQAIALGLITFAILRFGVLVTVLMILLDNLASAVPVLAHAASWAALPGNLSIALVLAIAAFGFYAARAGQPLFGTLDF